MVWTSDKILTRSGEGAGGAVHAFLFERIYAKRNHVWFERLAHHSPFVFGLYDTVNVLCQKMGSKFILNDPPSFLLRKQTSYHKKEMRPVDIGVLDCQKLERFATT